MKVTYCITQFDFFSSHKGGQISHALGIINGIKSNNISCDYIGPQNEYYNNNFFNTNVNVLKFKYKIYVTIFKLINSEHKIIIRKNIENIIILFLFSFLFSRKKRESVIFEINGFTFERYLEVFMINKLYTLALLLHKIILLRFKYIYVVSSKLKNDLITGFIKLKKENITYIPNGVDVQNFNRSFDIKNPKYVFLFFGIFQDYNNYLLVINSFNAIRKKYGSLVELHFIGFGKNQELLNSIPEIYNGIYVHSPRNVSEINTMKICNNFCIGLIPLSSDISVKYLSPIKLFDYINMGMPVIVSDMYSDAKDLPNINSFISKYKSDNTISLFNTMEEFIKKDKSFYEKINNNKHLFCEKNSWNKRMENLINFCLT